MIDAELLLGWPFPFTEHTFTAKDAMLYLLSQPFWKSGEGIGKVLEFAGSGVEGMGLDERATLTNMAVEAGGFTGIIAADEVIVDFLNGKLEEDYLLDALIGDTRAYAKRQLTWFRNQAEVREL